MAWCGVRWLKLTAYVLSVIGYQTAIDFCLVGLVVTWPAYVTSALRMMRSYNVTILAGGDADIFYDYSDVFRNIRFILLRDVYMMVFLFNISNFTAELC